MDSNEKYRKFPNHQRVKSSVFGSKYSWQERIAWLNRIIEWSGRRGENEEWQSILHNSKDIALSLKVAKSNRIVGEKNPAFNHGGRLSPFSDKFVGKTSKEDAVAKMKKTKACNPQNENTKVEYYLRRGRGLCQAILALKDRQAVGSLDNFIRRYGQEEGTNKWKNRQEKWLKSYKKSNFSKISQKLFWSIVKDSDMDLSSVYFAELNDMKVVDKSGRNHELVLAVGDNCIKPDFIDISKQLIIEFDGNYWHGEIGHGNKEREKLRDSMIEQAGYKVLHICESDYKKNPRAEIEKCINFLTQ